MRMARQQVLCLTSSLGFPLMRAVRGVPSPVAAAAAPLLLLCTVPIPRRGSLCPVLWRRSFAQQQDIVSWSPKQVRRWAEGVLEAAGQDPKHARLLEQQEVTGKVLSQLGEEKLRADGLPRDAAIELANAIATLAGSRASDPFLVLESLPQMQEWKKLHMPAPATAVSFPFQEPPSAMASPPNKPSCRAVFRYK